MRGIRVLLALSSLAMLAVAVWFRWRLLGNMPGLNGDEAWYGVQALEWLRGGHYLLRTPSGVPVNPLFFGPLVLVHAFFEPSVGLLRSVAVAAGLVTLAMNYALARWVWDRPTAVLSTLVLAVLPVNIIYSRLAWDACLSLATTLPVLYLSLAALTRPARGSMLLTAAAAVLCVAALVHPTNLVTGAALLPAAWIVGRPSWTQIKGRRWALAGAALATVVALAASAALLAQNPRVRRAAAARAQRVLQWTDPHTAAHSLALAAVRYPRLFTGGTVYRFTAGSASMFEWPASLEEEPLGADAIAVWCLLGAAGWLAWRSFRRDRRKDDLVLLLAWAIQLVAFLAVAGVDGLKPHYERYALCLIAPAVALAARGAILAVAGKPSLSFAGAVAISLAGWLVLADFQRSFFDFIGRTGGRSHMAFVTSAQDPKQAALEHLLVDAAGRGPCFVIASEWWTYWPMRYFALGRPSVRVVQPGDEVPDAELQKSLAEGRVWLVELSPEEAIPATVAQHYRPLAHLCFRDYSGRPALHAIRVVRRGSPDPADR